MGVSPFTRLCGAARICVRLLIHDTRPRQCRVMPIRNKQHGLQLATLLFIAEGRYFRAARMHLVEDSILAYDADCHKKVTLARRRAASNDDGPK